MLRQPTATPTLLSTCPPPARVRVTESMHFTEVMEQIARGFEIVGALVLILGLVWSAVLSIRVWRRSGSGE